MHHIVDDGSIIRVEATGFFSEGEMHRHFEALSLVIARCRGSKRAVIALIDMRRSATQAATTARMLTEATNRLYNDPADRVAIVVSSMLLKLQLERILREQDFGIFLNIDDAERFLARAISSA